MTLVGCTPAATFPWVTSTPERVGEEPLVCLPALKQQQKKTPNRCSWGFRGKVGGFFEALFFLRFSGWSLRYSGFRLLELRGLKPKSAGDQGPKP